METSQANYTSKVSGIALIGKGVLKYLEKAEAMSKQGKQKVIEKYRWKIEADEIASRCLQLVGGTHKVVLNKEKKPPCML